MSKDILLSLPENRIPHNCGIGAVFASSSEISTPAVMTSILHTLQPRGQEGAGMWAANREKQTRYHKDSGYARHVLHNGVLDAIGKISPHIAIGNDRYSTSGDLDASQPFVENILGDEVALVHNGNVTNAATMLKKLPVETRKNAVSDSWILLQMIKHAPGQTLEEKIQNATSEFEGAYNLIIATTNDGGKIFALRDPQGFRPLSIGEIQGKAIVLSSETSAFSPIQAKLLRDVKEGEAIMIDKNGIKTMFFDKRTNPENTAHCIFEYVYIASPDSFIFGRSVSQIRYRLGAALAKRDFENGLLPEVVIGVQQSAILYAQGYSEEIIKQILKNPKRFQLKEADLPNIISQLTPKTGLVANPYAGRIFISPFDRELNSRGKQRASPFDVSGKEIVVIDDSIIRGNTSKAIIKATKEDPTMIGLKGASKVHLRSASPAVISPCFFGVDFSKNSELIAAQLNGDIDRIREELGATSLEYISHQELVSAVIGENIDLPAEKIYQQTGHCGACFTGFYPITVLKDGLFSKTA